MTEKIHSSKPYWVMWYFINKIYSAFLATLKPVPWNFK